MMRILLATFVATLSLGSAQALEIAWKGGAVVAATQGCANGWNPLNNDFYAFLWPAIPNTTNTKAATFSLHTGSSSEGFRLNTDGNFTTSFKNVSAVHDYTGTGTYEAQIRILQQTPAVITANTPFITGKLQINKFDFRATCLITINYALVRRVEHP